MLIFHRSVVEHTRHLRLRTRRITTAMTTTRLIKLPGQMYHPPSLL